MDYRKMGEFFRQLRIVTGIDQEQLAQGADLSIKFIESFEAGKRKPSVEDFIRLCTFYRLSPDIVCAFTLPTTIVSQSTDDVMSMA